MKNDYYQIELKLEQHAIAIQVLSVANQHLKVRRLVHLMSQKLNQTILDEIMCVAAIN